jgi:hypothetical protein
MIIEDYFYMKIENPYYLYRVKRISVDIFNITNLSNGYDCGNIFTIDEIRFYCENKNSIYKYLTEKEGLAELIKHGIDKS